MKAKSPPSEVLDTKTFPVLALLKDEELSSLNQSAKVIETISNVAVISEGIKNTSLYFVLAGFLVVTKRHAGQVYEVATIGPGQFFGEASILYDIPTAAEVRTTTATRLIQVSVTTIQDTLSSCANFKRSMHQTSLRRSAATALAVNHIFKTLPQKIRETILHNADLEIFEVDQVVFTEQTNDTKFMYILISGSCEAFVLRANPNNQRIIIARLVAGDEIGDIPVVTNQPQVATVFTKSKCALLKIPVHQVRNWMARYSDFDYALRYSVKSKLNHIENVIQQAVHSDS